jgi:hypothetical protein
MRKWRKDSQFGDDGARVPVDRKGLAVLKARAGLKVFNGPGKLTATARLVLDVMLKMLGADGRLDPSVETLAHRTGKCASAVELGLKRLRALGFLTWVRRIARCGSRVWQTSNAYQLTPDRCDPVTQGGVVPIDLVKKGGSGGAWLTARTVHAIDRAARQEAARQLEVLGFPDRAALMRP